MIKGYVYLTIELEARELASKSLLAARLMEQDYAVIIGRRTQLCNDQVIFCSGVMFL